MVKKGMAHKGPDRQTLNDEYRHIADRITVNDKSPPEDVGRLLVLSHVS
jgi:hypothetical protein